MTRTTPADVAADLLRTALLAKLAVDVGNPRLARRAARHSAANARLLAGLDLPRHEDDDEDDDLVLPDVDDLLAIRYPRTTEQEAT